MDSRRGLVAAACWAKGPYTNTVFVAGQGVAPYPSHEAKAANLKHAQRIRAAVLTDIKVGTFNLSTYFPDYQFAERHASDTSGRTLTEWPGVWAKLSARSLEDSTLQIYQRHLKAY